mmetsp:Transcript_33358/g.64352  ORF Transcript_33358/g.64352 Transcript_33358/m.64352 type:complete len:368 (-) Transcript_33358:295-1398(-)
MGLLLSGVHMGMLCRQPPIYRELGPRLLLKSASEKLAMSGANTFDDEETYEAYCLWASERGSSDDLELLRRAMDEEEALSEALGVLPPQATEDAATEVCHLGVSRLQNILRKTTASRLRSFVLEELERTESLQAAGSFSAVLAAYASEEAIEDEASSRWDVRLPLSPVVREGLRELLGEDAKLGLAFERLVGNDAELYEMAAIVSAPGAAPQVVHADTEWTDIPCLFTAFVALQDVESAMGPTCFIRRSHTEAMHARFDEEGEAFLASSDARAALLDCGDAALYDSRLLHAGGRNRAQTTRVLFYVTFRHPDAAAIVDDAVNEEAHSILPKYRGKLKLGQLRHLKEKGDSLEAKNARRKADAAVAER